MVTVSPPGDSIQTTNDGFDYDMSNEVLFVPAGLILSTQTGTGVSSNTFANLGLINNGEILSLGPDDAVTFTSGSATVTNNALGVIFGAAIALNFNSGTNCQLTNLGQITGLNTGVNFGNVTSILCKNFGYIFGGSYGVGFEHTGGELDNFRAIKSDLTAIVVNTGANQLTTINNAHGATINGLTDAVDAVAGMFRLSNHGTVIGAIQDEANLNDGVVNFGVIRGSVLLGGGNDVFRDVGGGSSGPVFGGDGNDRLIGGSHADQFYGGAGNDRLTGGGGKNSFFFDTALNAATNVDTITDFTPGHDTIWLDFPFFGGGGTLGVLGGSISPGHFHNGAPVNGNAQVFYTRGNGYLYFDPDGTGASPAIHFATLANHPFMHNTDFKLILEV
jgi:Ca2+-binding RTX toxin-like protein